MECRPGADHHGDVRTDTEEPQDDIVEPRAKHARLGLDVAVQPSSGARFETERHVHAPAAIVLAPGALDVGEVARDLNPPLFGDRGRGNIHRNDDAR